MELDLSDSSPYYSMGRLNGVIGFYKFMVERRYHMDFNQNHVAAASNELFFKDVVPEIQKKVKREPALRDPLRRAFSNSNEMLAYYKDKYKFNTQIEQF